MNSVGVIAAFTIVPWYRTTQASARGHRVLRRALLAEDSLVLGHCAESHQPAAG